MKYIITFLILLSSFCIFSQNKIAKKDKETYNKLINELQNGSVEEGLKLANSTYNTAIKEDNKVLEILMLSLLADGNVKKGNFLKANDFFLNSFNKITNMNESYLKDSLLIQNFNVHGKAYLDSGNYAKGIKKINESLVISKKNRDSILIGDSYKWLGNAYAMQELYDDAIFYYTECVKYDTSVKMKFLVNSNLGNIYSRKKEYIKAERYLLQTLEATDDDNFNLMVSNVNLAILYTSMERYQKAHRFYLKANEYALKDNNKINQLESKLTLITSFTNIKDYESAKRYMKICDSLVNEVNSNLHKMSLYETIYESSAKMNNYKMAFENAEKYMIFHDSLFSIEKTKIIKDLKIKHESDLKETEIIAQQKLIKSQKTQNTALLIGLGVILLSLLSVVLSYKKRLSAQKTLLKKRAELANEKMNTVLEKQKVETYQSHIEGQNKERKRISQELHDGILGRLFGTRIGLGFLEFKENDTIKQQYNQFLEELQHIEKEIRDVSHKLSSDFESEELSFPNTVNQLLKETSFTGNFDFLFNASKDIEWDVISSLVKINLYRILQESLQNIIKHAQAKQVILDFSLSKDQLVMQITDNGVGFSTTENNDGIGIKNIASRVNDINGTLDITSKKGEGTTIHISIPYESM